MKILVIGLGSIGTRHLNNILHAGYTDVAVVSRSGVLPPAFAHLRVFISVSDALAAASFDAAILCTPTSFHMSDLSQLLLAKVERIYVEKPVSHSAEGLEEILSLADAYCNTIVVGYDLHFDPGMQKVKELIDTNVTGKVVSANAVVGQYLPDWRPHEDYRQGMSAKKITGGGVMLDLVHEFDYLYWLLGKASTIACQYTNTGSLEIETEDVCDVLLRFESGATGTIHLDYLQPALVRTCLITGSKGTIHWNLANSAVSWTTHDKQQGEFSYKGYERNNRFVDIMNAFLQQPNDTRLTNLRSGIDSLKMVLAAKHSCETQSFVKLSDFSIKTALQ